MTEIRSSCFGASVYVSCAVLSLTGFWVVTDSYRERRASTKEVPSLNGQQRMLVLRARSKLERDQWCWALNVEMERLVRAHTVREAAVRQQGNIL